MLKQAVLLGGERLLGRRAETLPLLDEMIGMRLMHRLAREGIRRFLLVECAAELEHQPSGLQIERCERDQLPDRMTDWHGDVLICSAACVTDVDLRGVGTIAGDSVALLHEHPPYAGDVVVTRGGDGRITAADEAVQDGDVPEAVFACMAAVQAERLAALGFEAIAPQGMRSRIIGGYWRAVRKAADYAGVQQALLTGKVDLPLSGRRRGCAIIGRGATVAPGVRFTGRCFIGDGAEICPDAEIGEGAVICGGVRVGHGARVEMSCIWRGCSIPPGRRICNLLVMPQEGNAALRQILPYMPRQNT